MKNINEYAEYILKRWNEAIDKKKDRFDKLEEIQAFYDALYALKKMGYIKDFNRKGIIYN